LSEITQLIDKLDTFEIVRNKIAVILVTESAAQVALAIAAGKPDPSLWALKVYTERASPWDDYEDGSVIVNVWFDATSVDESASNTVRNQTMRGTFNIDVIGFGVSKPNGTGGHVPGDELAALNAQRGLRLVRNIIMASSYTYLGLRGVVGQRMPQSISSFQPQLNSNPTVHAVGTRLALGVRYEEYAPQYEPVILQELGVTITRAEDALVLVELEYQYPL
jgi:hypothetical protein